MGRLPSPSCLKARAPAAAAPARWNNYSLPMFQMIKRRTSKCTEPSSLY